VAAGVKRRIAVILGALLVTLGASACGVPSQSHPEKVDREDLPFGLTHDEPSKQDSLRIGIAGSRA
jgi:hypothetical protein